MNPNKRLLSLDVLRGITVAGMILVNNTGKCGYNFAAFAHAKWDGFSPADLVFPMFMFLMGITLPLLHMPSGMAFRQPIWYFRCLCS